MPLLIVIPPLVIIGLIVTLGLAFTSRSLSQGVTAWLKDASRLAVFTVGLLEPWAVKLARWITHNIGAEFHDLERLGVTWFSGLYQWADLVITNALEWPLWLWKFQRWFLFVELPKLIQAVPHIATSVVHTVTTRVVRIERTIVKLPKLSRAQAKALVGAAVALYVGPFLTELVWLRRHFHALTHALPIPQAWPGERRTWRELEAWRKTTALRLTRLEKLLAASGLALAVAKMTSTKFECWRPGGNIWRTLRHVCGFPKWLMDFLILGSIEAFIVTDLCDFSDLLIKTAEGLRPGLMGFVDVENALIGCHDFDAPRVFSLPTVSLPDLVDAVSFAA